MEQSLSATSWFQTSMPAAIRRELEQRLSMSPPTENHFCSSKARLISTKDGDGVVWKGSGKGKILPGGALSYRGILYYQTTSQKLAKLNVAPGVFEYEVDAEGKTHSKVWQWK
jgi:hypothetical protein